MPGQPRGIVDVLLDEQKKEGNDWLNDDNIRGILLNIVGGGKMIARQFILAVDYCTPVNLHLNTWKDVKTSAP